MISIAHILKDMLTNRTRLILTILAVAWGTFSIASMLAVGEGLRLTFSEAINHVGKGALIVSGSQTTEAYQGQASGIKIILTDEDLERLRKGTLGRAEIAAESDWSVKIYYGKKTRSYSTMAVTENYAPLHGVRLHAGSRFINAEDNLKRRQVIVLGTKTVEKLFSPNENPIGQYVYLEKYPFLVVGVQRKTLQLLSTSSSPDDFLNWIPYGTYQELTGKRQYTSFIIAPHDLNDVLPLQQEIKRLIAHPRQLNPDDSGMLNVINLQKEKKQLNLFFYGIEVILGIIGTLTLLVAGVGIANVMYISVKRATREIGIRMALGASTYEILSYYASEALLTTAIGGVLGLTMASLLIALVNQIPIHSELLDYFGNPRPVLSMNVMCLVIFILGLIGFFAGIFPARKAALIHPAEALRHE